MRPVTATILSLLIFVSAGIYFVHRQMTVELIFLGAFGLWLLIIPIIGILERKT